MNTPRPKPSKIQNKAASASKGAAVIALWVLGITAAGLFFNMVENDGERTPPDAKSSPSATPSGTPITWPTITSQCRDGWHSPSIGKRGACSWHGGVITVYHSSEGNLATLCPPPSQPTTLERARDLLAADGTVDCDFGQSPNPDPSRSDGWGVLAPTGTP